MIRPSFLSSYRRSVLLAAGLAGVAFCSEPGWASDGAPQASGKFTGSKWSIEPVGAYAFPADEVGMDDGPGIKVAVSNSGFVPEAFDVLYDREHAISDQFADDQTLVVYFHFDRTGKYRGLSYMFGSGDGCGFCFDGRVSSTVKVADGRIKGRVALAPQEGEIDFDVSFDVPVASTDYGKPLGGDFGEVGKAYAAFHRALVDGTVKDLEPLLTPDRAANIAKYGDEVHGAWRDDHPTASYRITKGWQRDNRALLVVEGENSYANVSTEAHLLRNDKGVWQVDNELMQIRFGD